MMNPDKFGKPNPIDTAVRKSARERRLMDLYGSARPACAMCGVSDPVVIVSKRRVVEEHHIAGRALSDFTAPLCRNHHELTTEELRKVGTASTGQNVTDTIGAMLIGIGAYLRILADALIELGRWITTAGNQLIQHLQDAGMDADNLSEILALVEPLPWFLHRQETKI